ncbi:1-hydroxycarotenoid 3,4-desaturase CrtD [uncultured Thiohalocapsa sp.]|uniref:1-hydroxycarotenoid 3,4-desaturase CrtD n=1 Tax=uncultured Thiohalocapsa sp. TaxID=768990 RepID=UPI0025CE0788|nr:1-hydroxycarotenoid 3,4-desaturase CrtD [uncultured Thiohalocapsa sp.]
MAEHHVVIIGAGMGGLAAALRLAARGLRVTVLERALKPGGKMREVAVNGALVDSGPTVVTMREVFEDLFDAAGTSLADHLTLRPADILARHAWSAGERLDLYADIERSVEAIGDFAGSRQAQLFRDFCARADDMFRTLERAFIHEPAPTPLSLVLDSGLIPVARLKPYSTLWQDLGRFFPDERLRQLFGRYATYVGSSPFRAPPTLGIVAHVELGGVWLVEGGIHRLPAALAALAEAHGVTLRYGSPVAEVLVRHGRAAGVRLADGEQIAADAVLCNADSAALAAGLFGRRPRRAVRRHGVKARSLSAVTFSVCAPTSGFPLVRHNVFFSRDYPGEFAAIFEQGRLPDEPTVYVCAQDRGDDGGAPDGPERLLCLVNAPPRGDIQPFDAGEIEQCEEHTFNLLARCGLQVDLAPERRVITTPTEFEHLFPATGGALYGRTSHGWQGPFSRSGARSKVPRLYLAGGSVHPGPGVPMAAISGRLAAEAMLADLSST